MKATIITYQDLLTAQPTDLIAALKERLPMLWSEVARAKEYADLGDTYADCGDPCVNAQNEISHLIGLLKRAHADLTDLRTHRHEWSENSYCLICGADGRA